MRCSGCVFLVQCSTFDLSYAQIKYVTLIIIKLYLILFYCHIY